ncbi:MAG: HAD-IA family hydrolase [Candidatus Omnitrophota bacterium]
MALTACEVLLFDVDGTLVDSRLDIANAMNFALASAGLPKKEPAEITAHIGTGVSDLVRKCLGESRQDMAGRVLEAFSGYYLEHPADTSKLYPHVKEVLEHFKGKRKFILTNRYARFADVTLGKLGIRAHFEDIIGGDDESCMKPSACILERLFSGTATDKDKAMIIGDMAIDINTGKNAGIRTCWVTYGLGKREDVEPLRPDYVIDDMIELKNIVR